MTEGERASSPTAGSYAARVADLQPPELADLVGVAERPRAGDWSLRAALVRYAQFRPGEVRDLMEVVRRIELALHPHGRLLAKEGPAIWGAVVDGSALDGDAGAVVEVLRVAQDLDRLADVVVAWAQHREGELPDDAVTSTTAATTRRLDELGVPHEERPHPPRTRV